MSNIISIISLVYITLTFVMLMGLFGQVAFAGVNKTRAAIKADLAEVATKAVVA